MFLIWICILWYLNKDAFSYWLIDKISYHIISYFFYYPSCHAIYIYIASRKSWLTGQATSIEMSCCLVLKVTSSNDLSRTGFVKFLWWLAFFSTIPSLFLLLDLHVENIYNAFVTKQILEKQDFFLDLNSHIYATSLVKLINDCKSKSYE